MIHQTRVGDTAEYVLEELTVRSIPLHTFHVMIELPEIVPQTDHDNGVTLSSGRPLVSLLVPADLDAGIRVTSSLPALRHTDQTSGELSRKEEVVVDVDIDDELPVAVTPLEEMPAALVEAHAAPALLEDPLGWVGNTWDHFGKGVGAFFGGTPNASSVAQPVSDPYRSPEISDWIEPVSYPR